MSCTCNNFFVAKLYIYRGRMVFSLCSVFIDHLFLCASEWQHITTFHAKTCNIPRTQFSLILLIKNKQSSRGQNKLNDTQNTQKMIYKRNIRLYDVTVGKKNPDVNKESMISCAERGIMGRHSHRAVWSNLLPLRRCWLGGRSSSWKDTRLEALSLTGSSEGETGSSLEYSKLPRSFLYSSANHISKERIEYF